MRLIDADALKKDWSMANKCEECPQDVRKCQYEQNFTRMDICEMLDEAPTVSGWISVKDRLPEKEGQYLCWVHINKVHFCYQIHLWYSGAWRWANNNVLYWMPLPEPPKEDNK